MPESRDTPKFLNWYAAITYRPKWISQEVGNAQACALGGFFLSPEAIREYASCEMAGRDGWRTELSPLNVPHTKNKIPVGEEVRHVSDPSKLLNGYVIAEVEVCALNEEEGRTLGSRVKLLKRR